MTSGSRIERRQTQHAALTLEHSFLFRIRPALAWPLVAGLMAAGAAVEHFAPEGLWFGPIYLAVLALAAWSINSVAALAIGLGLISVKLAFGVLPFYDGESPFLLSNAAVRVTGIAIVIGFIGMARKSCEREWRFARTDALTGAWNRPAFFEILESNRDEGGWSAMIYADLDGLKALNDAEGHARGDLGLKLFAETVRRTIRAGDVFARVGGDEFVIFMRLKDEAAGLAVARRLHRALNTQAPEDGSPHLTCSVGVLVLRDGSKSIDAELRAADALMYEAKKLRAGVFVATARQGESCIEQTVGIPVLGPWEQTAAVRRDDRGTGARARPEATIAA